MVYVLAILDCWIESLILKREIFSFVHIWRGTEKFFALPSNIIVYQNIIIIFIPCRTKASTKSFHDISECAFFNLPLLHPYVRSVILYILGFKHFGKVNFIFSLILSTVLPLYYLYIILFPRPFFNIITCPKYIFS